MRKKLKKTTKTFKPSDLLSFSPHISPVDYFVGLRWDGSAAG
jgi:hypothetical protein